MDLLVCLDPKWKWQAAGFCSVLPPQDRAKHMQEARLLHV